MRNYYFAKFQICIALLVLLVTTTSCKYLADNENEDILTKAEQMLNSEPEKALSLLKSAQIGLLNESEYAYFTLLQVRARDMAGITITSSEAEVTEARDYFIKKKDTEKVVLACFVLGRVCESQKNMTKALYNYQLADAWAAKADNNISNFSYSRIPYNIASLLCREGNYEESLKYLHKALKYIDDKEDRYTDKLYALELAATNFQQMDKADSALYYYDEALKIVKANNDKLDESRILYNRCVLLYDANDYAKAEEKCKQLLSSVIVNNDSLHAGLLHMTLARIYNNTNRTDLASIEIYKSEELLKAENCDVTLALFELLVNIEQKKGNIYKAEEYKQAYSRCEAKKIAKQKSQNENLIQELEEIKNESIAEFFVLMDKNRDVTQRQLLYKRIAGVLAILGLIALGFTLYIKRGKRLRAFRMYCKEEMMRNIAQRNDLVLIMSELSHLKESENRNKIMDMVDNLTNHADWHRMSPYLNFNYGSMFDKLQTDFPMLDKVELGICCLTCTQMFNADEMAEILNITPDVFKRSKASLVDKIESTGHRFKDIRKYFNNNPYTDPTVFLGFS